MYLNINKSWWDRHKKAMMEEFSANMQGTGFIYDEDKEVSWVLDEQNMTLDITETTESEDDVLVSIQVDMTPEFLAKMLEIILKRGNKLKTAFEALK